MSTIQQPVALSAGYRDLGYAGLSPSTFAPNYGGQQHHLRAQRGAGIAGTGQFSTPFQAVNGEPQGFGHEGRIPPMPGDFRLDPRQPVLVNRRGPSQQHRRRPTRGHPPDPQFDTWSTDYINAPDSDITAQPDSPPTARPIYPSFPPPYPSPLRGIQIQIRVSTLGTNGPRC